MPNTHSNLTSLFSDIADAIREKTGSTETIVADNFPTAIASIGTTAVEEDSVFFYDYDGTIVYSYTKTDFLALTELPANPTHEGLTTQGWNWTLSDAKTYISKYDFLNIGQLYSTDDNKSRFYIDFPENISSTQLSLEFNWYQTSSAGVSIDWGDNTEAETVSGTGYKTLSHTYSTGGSYIIKANVTSGTMRIGSNVARKTCLGDCYATNCLSKVELGTNVNQILQYAFYQYYNLDYILMPAVSNIAQYAFYNCCNMCNVIFQKTYVTIIGNYTFSYAGLQNISFNNKIQLGSNAFERCYLKEISLPEITSISNSAFRNNSNGHGIIKVTIPNTISSIGNYAFADNKSISLNLTNLFTHVTSIGNYAFDDIFCEKTLKININSNLTLITNSVPNKNIEQVIIENSPQKLPNYLCYGFTSLKQINIPDSVTSIGDYVFSYCICLSNISIPNTVTSIGNNAFIYTDITNINIPNSVTTIGKAIFYQCKRLKSVTLSNNLVSINTVQLFGCCCSLKSITIPSCVTKIGSQMFYECCSLKSITIPETVTIIDTQAFQYCYSLMEISIPSAVTSIGNNAFRDCKSMNRIRFNSTTPPTIGGSTAFQNVPTVCIISVPTGSLSAYTSATNYPSSSTYTYVEED